MVLFTAVDREIPGPAAVWTECWDRCSAASTWALGICRTWPFHRLRWSVRYDGVTAQPPELPAPLFCILFIPFIIFMFLLENISSIFPLIPNRECQKWCSAPVSPVLWAKAAPLPSPPSILNFIRYRITLVAFSTVLPWEVIVETFIYSHS